MGLNQRALLWLEHLKAWQQSGTTQELYCKTNGIHPNTFSNWKRKLRPHLPDLPPSWFMPAAPVMPLVPVSLIDEPSGGSHQPISPAAAAKLSGITLSVGKYQITVAVDFDPTTLRYLLPILNETQ